MSRLDPDRKIILEGEEITEYDGIYGDIVKTYGRPAAEAFKEVVACGVGVEHAARAVRETQVIGEILTTEDLVRIAKMYSEKRRRVHRD